MQVKVIDYGEDAPVGVQLIAETEQDRSILGRFHNNGEKNGIRINVYLKDKGTMDLTFKDMVKA